MKIDKIDVKRKTAFDDLGSIVNDNFAFNIGNTQINLEVEFEKGIKYPRLELTYVNGDKFELRAFRKGKEIAYCSIDNENFQNRRKLKEATSFYRVNGPKVRAVLPKEYQNAFGKYLS